MTIWFPDTCNCAADVENQILLVKCKTHSTYNQMKTNNNNMDESKGKTEQQRTNQKNSPSFGLTATELKKMNGLKQLLDMKQANEITPSALL